MQKTTLRFHIPFRWSIAIMVVAGLVTWLVIARFSSQVSEEADQPFAAIEAGREKIEAVPSTSVIGTVIAVSGSSLTLAATPENNPELSHAATIIVLLTPDTLYSRSSVPSSVSAKEAENLASLYRFSSATLREITAGNGMMVNVRTGAPVKGKTEVTAESIEILETR